jgi:predicted permease
MLSDLFHRLRALLRRADVERELDDELRFHFDRRVETFVRSRHHPAEARRLARLEIGGLDQVKEEYRDALGVRLIQDLRRDLLLAVRMMRRQPGFVVSAVLTLALGIGATAAVFSLFDVLLLRPLPVHRPEELAHVYTSCRAGDVYCASAYPEFLDYRAQSRTFVDMAAFDPVEVSVSAGSGSWVASGLMVSTNYFSLLGIAPDVGRFFSAEWNVAADPPLVLAHNTWLTRFGGDPSIVGTTVRLSGGAFRVAGVAPVGFRGTRLDMRPEFWVPIETIARLLVSVDPNILAGRNSRWLDGIVGRLKPAVTFAQAQAEMHVISARLDASDPGRLARFVTIEQASRAALPPTSAGDITRFALLLMSSVAAVLLIGYANVSGLLLARNAVRRPELELRRALGASRGRLIRQLLSEYVLLSAAGTVVGLVVARGALSFLAVYDLPGALAVGSLDVELNPRVLMFAAVLLVVTGAFGLLPALWTTRGPLAGAERTTRSLRGQGVLLSAQVAVTVVLLVGAGLFVRSLQRGLSFDLGLASRPVLLAEMAPVLQRYSPDRTQRLASEAVSRLASMPGVRSASAARRPPLLRGSGFQAQEIEGYSRRPGEEIRFEANFVSANYFQTLGIRLLAGRDFTETDAEGSPAVAVISDTMARRYWPSRDPVGTHLTSRSFPAPVRIVGVVNDVTVGLDGDAGPFVYMPLRQNPRFLSAPIPIALLVRAEGEPAALVTSIRAALRELDPTVPITDITTLDARIADLLMPQRLGTVLLSGLAGLTVVLVVVGVVGTVGYGISRRRREIGVRLALGAKRAEVVAPLIRGTFLVVAVGIGVGLIGAVALARFIATFLYGIEPTDTVTIATALGVLFVAAGAASFVPAWRATRIDPAEVLKAS